jgi:TetR/AcrR family transcriptional repressor of bet genes
MIAGEMETEVGEPDVTLLGRSRRPRITRRREAIVEAAVSVLGRQGYSETSLKEIAREAGVAPGLLHYHFESKEDLLVAVLAEIQGELTGTWEAALRGVEDPLERLIAGLAAMEGVHRRRPELWRLLFDMYTLSLSNPTLQRHCQAVWARATDALEGEIRHVLGQLPAYTVVPPHDLAGAVAAALQGISLAALVESSDPDKRFRALRVLLLSVVVTAYVSAGQEPPLARLAGLAGRP